MIIYGLLFYIFAFFAIVSALTVIIVKNPVHSVLWLIMCFFSSAGLFMLLGAEFIAIILIIVYVGAVAVLFLFVVMMLNIDFVKLKSGFQKYLPVCLLISAVLFLDIYLVLSISVNQENLLIANPLISIPDPKEITNTHAIGMVLYTEYFYPFQIAGIILLVSMIGSIVLTLRARKNVKKQNIDKQSGRKRHEAVKLLDVPSGKGIK